MPPTENTVIEVRASDKWTYKFPCATCGVRETHHVITLGQHKPSVLLAQTIHRLCDGCMLTLMSRMLQHTHSYAWVSEGETVEGTAMDA